MAHPPLLQQRLPTATTPASHHWHKPTSTNATFKKRKKKKRKNTTREISTTTNLKPIGIIPNLKSTAPSQNPKSRRDGGKRDQRDLDGETRQHFGPSRLGRQR